MANGQHGGYRQPANPAPVSGPGALSQRTDGGPADTQPIRAASGGSYGERQEIEGLQKAAPLPQEQRPVDTSGLVPMSAPTQHPGMDVTAGATIPNQPQEPGEFDMFRYGNYFKALRILASRSDVSPATRQLIRQIGQRL